MIGSLLALFSAAIFALNNIFIRRAVLIVSDASIGTLISVPFSFLFNRKLELFSRAVIIGTLMVVLDTIFIV